MRRSPLAIPCLAATIAGAGCTIVGPASIGGGRGAYGEVITKTNDQQLLRSIVMDRFSETLVLTSVTSVTANVTLRASAGGQIGIGPGADYAGNLVPVSLGAAYEENPTISYVPVETPEYLQQIMSPLPLGSVLLLVRSLDDKQLAMMMFVERINGLTNPLVLRHDAQGQDKFERAIELMGKLGRTGATDIVSLDEGYAILVRLSQIPDRADLDEFLTLLELTDLKPRAYATTGAARPDSPNHVGLTSAAIPPGGKAADDVLIIPLRSSATPDHASIAVMTRSVYDIVRVAAASADVPEAQVAAGMARPAPAATMAQSLVQIRCAADQPADALVATKVHGNWYYIDNRDLRSKDYFRVLCGVWSAQVAATKSGAATPVLTVGVSR